MKRLMLSAVLACAAAAAGCQSTSTGENPAVHHHENMWAAVNKATATLSPTASGPTVKGTVTFTDVEGGVKVEGTVSGLAPDSVHAFHIHEFGDISGAVNAEGKIDGMSAGSHYNPAKMVHGGPDSPQHHAGDLGNIKADGTGTAKIDETIHGLSVAGMVNPIIGRGVVIHESPDDLKTDPTGGAGKRIAVGVIGIAKSVGAPPAIGTRPAK
jgi:Cu-Zn family superoxide dismutase